MSTNFDHYTAHEMSEKEKRLRREIMEAEAEAIVKRKELREMHKNDDIYNQPGAGRVDR